MKRDIDGFEHLHVHTTNGSILDGYAFPEEYASRAVEINQKFLCITDHGHMGAIPRQIQSCENHNLEWIFGCELYYNPAQIIATPEEQKQYIASLDEDAKRRYNKSFHLLALAYNEIGYRNLTRLCSWGYLKGWGGLPRRPRINTEILEANKEGIIFTSCCYASEIGYTFDTLGKDAAMDKVAEYIARFGENFRLEIMMLDFKKQKAYDMFIIEAHQKFGIPIILSQDAHYAHPEDCGMQRMMLMIQNQRTLAEMEKLQAEGNTDLFELQDAQLWQKSEEELNEMWNLEYQDVIDYDIYRQAKLETVSICHKAKGVKLDRSNKLPIIPNADEILTEEVYKGLARRKLEANEEHTARIKEELDLIKRKGFSSYFLIQKMFMDEARRAAPRILGFGNGSEAFGPGRGSAVGSFCCYLLGITSVNPLKHGLLFSRFLSESRGGKTIKLRFKNIDPILPEPEG